VIQALSLQPPWHGAPTLIDAELERHGVRRSYGRGEGDARGDFDRDYSAWYGRLFPSHAAEAPAIRTTTLA
jgi:hypothetical protein